MSHKELPLRAKCVLGTRFFKSLAIVAMPEAFSFLLPNINIKDSVTGNWNVV